MAEALAEGHPGGAERSAKPPLRERVRTWARGHRRAIPVALVVLAALVLGALWLLHYLSTFETTDDAQVDGNISAIGARIAGTVVAVHVENNDRVGPGDMLVELDPADYDVALAQADANLEQARHQRASEAPLVPITTVTNRTSIATAQKDVASARAELAGAVRDKDAAFARLKEAQANSQIARIELGRSEHLVDAGAVPQQDLDEHRATAEAREAAVNAERANVEVAGQRVEQARAKLAETDARLEQVRENAPTQLTQSNASVDARESAVRAAEAALDQARLNLDYARIVAPVAGIVGQKSVNVGDRVQSGQELLAIVQVEDLWVTANYKETQLRHMHPGQRADVKVDALGRTFHGSVESMPGASGARFSLLPPENATGNYVKVVQRLPVRIRLDPGQDGLDRLRPGMSVEPRVWLD
jgi:membrane fusion protein (multidrug efflux system)